MPRKRPVGRARWLARARFEELKAEGVYPTQAAFADAVKVSRASVIRFFQGDPEGAVSLTIARALARDDAELAALLKVTDALNPQPLTPSTEPP